MCLQAETAWTLLRYQAPDLWILSLPGKEMKACLLKNNHDFDMSLIKFDVYETNII